MMLSHVFVVLVEHKEVDGDHLGADLQRGEHERLKPLERLQDGFKWLRKLSWVSGEGEKPEENEARPKIPVSLMGVTDCIWSVSANSRCYWTAISQYRVLGTTGAADIGIRGRCEQNCEWARCEKHVVFVQSPFHGG